MRPRIGVTLGDPAGIGPEVVVKALAHKTVTRALEPVVVGDLELLRETAARLRMPVRFTPEGERAAAAIPVVAVGEILSARARRPGKPSLEGGRAAYRYIEAATRMAQQGAIDGFVTAPINKAIVARAGFPISGHTELLKDLTGAREVRMMLAGDRLKVVLVTTHVAHAAVAGALSMRDVTRTVLITDEHLRRYHRIAEPRIAVAALNPHAGEGGLFGREEQTIIAPAVQRALRAGAHVSGPHPADSLFFRAVSGEFDAVVAMYHDQGLIPLKLLHFHDGVNVTLGLPILRTSPDHGTAYDIAGRGEANAGSMTAALLLAARMAKGQKTMERGHERRTARSSR